MKKTTAAILMGFSTGALFVSRQLNVHQRRSLKRIWEEIVCPPVLSLFNPKVARKLFSCREPAGAANTPEYSHGIN